MADTGFVLPTANNDDNGVENSFSNPGNAQVGTDVAFANPDGTDASWFYKTFGFGAAGLSSGDAVNGIEIKARSLDTFNDETWWWEVGFDATTNVVTDYTLKRLPTTGNAYASSSFDDFIIGGATNKLGFTGDADTLLNAAFRLVIKWVTSDGAVPNEAHLANISIKIHFTAAGGSTVVLGQPQVHSFAIMRATNY